MRRRLILAAVSLALLAGACGDAIPPIPAHDAWIGVDLGAETVVSGRAFPLTVTRIWRRDRTASAWGDAVLAPLVLRATGVERHEDAEHVRETRRFRAFAFALEDVHVAPVPFAVRPAAGGDPTVVHAPAFTLRVRPEVLPSQAGSPELPGAPLADPPARAPWVVLGLAILGLAGLGLVAARRRTGAHPTVDEPEPPRPSPDGPALEALARLRSAGGDVASAADVVRAYVAARFGVRAPYLATEEVLADPALATTPAERLEAVLIAADREKFASYRALDPEREARLDDAEAFVRATAQEGSP